MLGFGVMGLGFRVWGFRGLGVSDVCGLGVWGFALEFGGLL